jgi:hypothetical protein
LLIGLGNKSLQWFHNAKRIKIPEGGLELQFKRPMRLPRTRQFSHVMESTKERGKSWCNIENKRFV